MIYVFFFFFKQKTAYEMRISDWSSDVCSSDLVIPSNPIYDPVTNPYTFNPDSPTTYNKMTSTTVYDSLGNPLAAEIYYVRTSSSNSAATTNDWNVHLIVDGTELTPSSGASPMQLSFDTRSEEHTSERPPLMH